MVSENLQEVQRHRLTPAAGLAWRCCSHAISGCRGRCCQKRACYQSQTGAGWMTAQLPVVIRWPIKSFYVTRVWKICSSPHVNLSYVVLLDFHPSIHYPSGGSGGCSVFYCKKTSHDFIDIVDSQKTFHLEHLVAHEQLKLTETWKYHRQSSILSTQMK